MNFKHFVLNVNFDSDKVQSIEPKAAGLEQIYTLQDGARISKNYYFLGRAADVFYSLNMDKIYPCNKAVNTDEIPKSVISKYFFDQKIICGVIGCKGNSARFTPEVQTQAKQAGALIAEYGFVTLTGGLSGVMEKAAEGAKTSGGETLGILPGSDKTAANSFVEQVIPSGIGIARNYIIAQASDILIALNGGRGTLEEICYGLDFEKKVLSINSWQIPEVEVLNSTNEIKPYLDELFLSKFHYYLLKKYESDL